MTYRCKCKKTYCVNPRNVTLKTINVIIKEGEWVNVQLLEGGYFVDIIGVSMTSTYHFTVDEFKKYFHTIDEHRELEIDKILM